MTEKYLGYTIKEKNNAIQMLFDAEHYKQIIRNSHTLGITPLNYCKLLFAPCPSCGTDKIIITKLVQTLTKQFKSASSVHLFCFVNSKINTGLTETILKLNYNFSFALSVSSETIIYTPNDRSNYQHKETKATLTVFNDDIKTATILCRVKNNQVYSINENI